MRSSHQKLLVIAGLDPSGHAGLLRDVATAALCGVDCAVAPTALTAQNHANFFSANVVGAAVFKRQLQSILPLRQYGAIKMGMMGSRGIIGMILDELKSSKKTPPLVIDPVFQSSTGGVLLDSAGQKILFEKLVPRATIWTPNLFEAERFSGMTLDSPDAVENAALGFWADKGTAVLIKGFVAGRRAPGTWGAGGADPSGRQISDLFFDGKRLRWFHHRLLNRKGLRGTGCTLASLIASHLALKNNLERAVSLAEIKMQRWILRV